MRIIKAADYQDMSRKAANLISAQVIMKPDSVLGLATGSTPIGAYQKLEVYTPKRLDQRLISCAFLIAIWLRAVRKMRVCRIDIYLVKQIFVHKVVVTLIIGSWKPLVFVQIHGFHG